MSYERVFRAAASTPWMLAEEKLHEIEALLRLRLAGVGMSDEDRERYRAEAAPRSTVQGGHAVGVLPVYGVMSQRMNLMAEMSGGTSTERLAAEFRAMVQDPNVAAIVLSVDSPGGSVYGIDELATEIRNARNKKPIVAQANSLMASAAYYISSAANEIVVTPGGEVGSIGVFAMHLDLSEAEAAAGIRHTLIKAGKYKAEHNESFPLTEEARAHLEGDVQRYYEMFLNAVAAGRGVSASDVRNGFGEGRVVGAKEAVRLGMADRVGTLQETISRLQTPAGRGAISRREALAEAAVRTFRAESDEPMLDPDKPSDPQPGTIDDPKEAQRALDDGTLVPIPDTGEAEARLRRARV